MNRKLTVAIIAMSVQVASFSQNLSKDPCYARKAPLSYYAYSKMMRSHFNFTILGTQTPTSGFKVETNKPTVTLKGNIYSNARPEMGVKKKALIINLELTGGVSNDIQQILAGDQLNGYFKASLGFNVLFDRGNDAKFIMNNNFEKMITRKKVCEFREDVAVQIDTMLVLTAIINIMNAPVKTLEKTVDETMVLVGNDDYTIDHYSEPDEWRRPKPYAEMPDYYKKLIIGMIKKYGAVETLADDVMFIDFITKFKDDTNNKLRSAKLLSDYNKGVKFRKEHLYKYQLIDDNEIESYKHIWSSKTISWLNITATGLNASFKMYNASANILKDSNSFLPSVTASYNYFKKYTQANKYIYLRIGVGVKRVNSLPDLPKFDYKKETVINVTATETLKTEKTGTAYQGELAHGFGLEIPVEMYWAPWEHEAIPGLYGKLQYNYGEPWINKNKVSIDLGMVWNVTNADKDSKNVLTIIPFMNWANLVKEYKDVGKTKLKKLSDLFSVGVKFGIPVNLGK